MHTYSMVAKKPIRHMCAFAIFCNSTELVYDVINVVGAAS